MAGQCHCPRRSQPKPKPDQHACATPHPHANQHYRAPASASHVGPHKGPTSLRLFRRFEKF